MSVESIQQTLRQFSAFKERGPSLKGIVEQLKQEPVIEAFLQEVPEAATRLLEKDLTKAYEVVEADKHCQACPGLERCPNLLAGHQPQLIYDKGSLTVAYKPCSLKRTNDAQIRQKALIQSFYVPQDVLKATFRTLDKSDPGRQDAIEAAGLFVKHYLDDPRGIKGLYLYGQFGVGKTHIMGAIMNALAERAQVESLMVYTPDFFRELKGAIQDQTVEEKLEYTRKVPLLILDDIGAETMSPWIRDDVLGSILQRRMMNGLPTLFTSNYDLDELEEHLAYSNKSGTELLKAKRLMERIRYYCDAVSLSGMNRRAKK
jgi:primosomal protein DnaI